MEDEKMRSLECKRFMNLLDSYIDGDLLKEDEKFFYAHAATCKNCENELKIADMMKDAMKDVDDDITVPLKAQSAWRSAVRKEIRRKKNNRLIRTLTSVAAAFAVLVGTTFVMRGTGALPPEYKANGKEAYKAVQSTNSETQNAAVMMVRSMPETGEFVIESDGEIDSAVSAGDMPAVYEEEFIRSAQRVAQTDDFDTDLRLLHELTEEYEGKISEEYSNLALDARSATLVTQIPVELMDEYLTALDNIGHTVSVDRVSEEASLLYFDLEARLETRRMTADRLKALIPEASGEELLSLNLQLENVYAEIDELESQSLRKENDISYARITVTLNELPSATVIEKSTLSERTGEGFRQSASAIGRFFEDMIVSVAVIAPVLLAVIALSAIVIGVRYAVKKAGKKKEEK